MNIDPEFILVIKADGMADGEKDLRQMLLGSFLKNLSEVGPAPERIVCMGTGVNLTTTGSFAIDTLKKFAEAGTKIFSCGTCLEYYNKKDALLIGEVGNMKDTAAAMASRAKVLQIS